MDNKYIQKDSFFFRILKKLSIRQRLLSIVLVVYIPLLIMGFMIYKNQNQKIEFISLEIEGSKVITVITGFNNRLAIHRGLSSRYLGGDQSSETISSLGKYARELDEISIEIEKIGKSSPAKLNVSNSWEKVAKHWKKLKENFKTMTPTENFENHTELVAECLQVISDIGDNSGLILDPNYDVYYVMDLSVYKMPFLAETLGKTRAYGIKLLSQKTISPEEQEKILFLVQDLFFYVKFTRDSFDLARKYNPSESILKKEDISKLVEMQEKFIGVVKKEIISVQKLSMSPTDYFQIATNTINPTFELNQKVADFLVKKLGEKLENEKNNLYFLYGLFITCFIATIILAFILTKSITSQIATLVGTAKDFAEKVKEGLLEYRMSSDEIGKDFSEIPPGINNIIDMMVAPIQESSHVMAEMAKGNLREYVNGDYRGGHADIKNALNKTLDSFNEVIGIMMQAVGEMHNGAGQISEASQSLAQGSAEQAASVEEISAAITELSSQTKQAAGNAKRANELSLQTLSSSKKGGEMMNELRNAMHQIKSASDNISKIIKAIDDIAFQTNLLSLNAAVEAARAGKHGKGFAVVAEEVKRLSDRSAKAARETADLIQESINRANNGSEIAEKTFISLNEISGSVEEVAKLMKEVLIASEEQSIGLVEVEKSMQQIEQVTQNNASNSEEIASASAELAGQAESISEIVSKFQIKNSVNFVGDENVKKLKKIQFHSGASTNNPENKRSLLSNIKKGREKLNPESVISLEDKEFGDY